MNGDYPLGTDEPCRVCDGHGTIHRLDCPRGITGPKTPTIAHSNIRILRKTALDPAALDNAACVAFSTASLERNPDHGHPSAHEWQKADQQRWRTIAEATIRTYLAHTEEM